MDPATESPIRGRSVHTNGEGASIKEAAMGAASSMNGLYRVSQEFLEHQAKDRPYALLGAAAGIGFVLGGGLASRVAEILLSIGGRVLAAQVLETSWSNRAFEE